MKDVDPLTFDAVVSLDEVARCMQNVFAADLKGYLQWNVALSMQTLWDGTTSFEETQSALCVAFLVAHMNAVVMMSGKASK